MGTCFVHECVHMYMNVLKHLLMTVKIWVINCHETAYNTEMTPEQRSLAKFIV